MSSKSALQTWEGCTADHWRAVWRAGTVRLFASVASTNDVAAELAAADAPDFSVVLAEEQTHGRGRGGARWHARAGSSVLVSVLFRVERHTGTPGCAPVRVGLAVAESIEADTGARTGVKWPNDVVLPGHGKVAGVLCEGAFGHERGGYVIAGIGINITQASEEFAGELRGRACSIFSATGVVVERARFATGLLERLRALTGRVTEPLSSSELERLAQRDVLRDHEVLCDSGAGRIATGVARGIAGDGALIIEQGGDVTRVFTGTVRLADTHAYPGTA